MPHTIPSTLAPFLQEYDIEKLDPATAGSTIIERVLQFGNRAEIRWLFGQYARSRISEWVRRHADERLANPHRAFWRIVLEIEE